MANGQGVVIGNRFKRKLGKKTPDMQKAIYRCIKLLLTDPRHNSLRTHKLQSSEEDIWAAYVDTTNVVTFDRRDNSLFMRNHCNIDLLRPRQSW